MMKDKEIEQVDEGGNSLTEPLLSTSSLSSSSLAIQTSDNDNKTNKIRLLASSMSNKQNEDEVAWASTTIDPSDDDSNKDLDTNATLHQTFLYRLLGFPKPIGCYCDNNNNCASNDDGDDHADINMKQEQQEDEQTRFILSSPLLHMAMLSNLSTSYNVINIGYVLDLISQSSAEYKNQRTSESDGLCASSLLLGMVFGQLLGGILGDKISSRQRALFLVMCIQIIGSLGSAFFLVHSNSYNGKKEEEFTVYDSLAAWRFILGLGCGGVYPLAATMTSELVTSSSSSFTMTNDNGSANEDSSVIGDGILASQIKSKLVAVTFSTQGIGFLLVPLVTWFVVTLFDADDVNNSVGSSWAWKIILAVGCIPGIMVLMLQLFTSRRQAVVSKPITKTRYQPVQNERGTTENENADNIQILKQQSKTFTIEPQSPIRVRPLAVDVSWMTDHDHSDDEDNSGSAVDSSRYDNGGGVDNDSNVNTASPSIIQAIRTESNIVQKLGGTALCWFLFDVLFYGNTLFTPVVLREAFGTSETVSSTARDALVLSLLSLPGYMLSVLTIGRFLTPRGVQLQGFAMMGIIYLIIGINFEIIEQHKIGLLLLYGMTFMFANWGPNTTTFMMPSLTFSRNCRSTLNGVAAASGKMGALLGSTMFEPIAKNYGDSVVMILCAGVSAIGFILSFMCLEKQEQQPPHQQSSLIATTATHQEDQNNINRNISTNTKYHQQPLDNTAVEPKNGNTGPLNLSNSEML